MRSGAQPACKDRKGKGAPQQHGAHTVFVREGAGAESSAGVFVAGHAGETEQQAAVFHFGGGSPAQSADGTYADNADWAYVATPRAGAPALEDGDLEAQTLALVTASPPRRAASRAAAAQSAATGRDARDGPPGTRRPRSVPPAVRDRGAADQYAMVPREPPRPAAAAAQGGAPEPSGLPLALAPGTVSLAPSALPTDSPDSEAPMAPTAGPTTATSWGTLSPGTRPLSMQRGTDSRARSGSRKRAGTPPAPLRSGQGATVPRAA